MIIMIVYNTCTYLHVGPIVGNVKLELAFNPDTSTIGVRLHEHTLSGAKAGLISYMHQLISRIFVVVFYEF